MMKKTKFLTLSVALAFGLISLSSCDLIKKLNPIDSSPQHETCSPAKTSTTLDQKDPKSCSPKKEESWSEKHMDKCRPRTTKQGGMKTNGMPRDEKKQESDTKLLPEDDSSGSCLNSDDDTDTPKDDENKDSKKQSYRAS